MMPSAREQVAGWRNRIKRRADVDPATLTPHALNWRTHGAQQRAVLEQVLDEIGFVQDVIVNERTGNLVDGHLRLELALERGEPSLPVVYVDLSEEEERRILLTLDPISAMAGVDTANLTALMEGMALGEDAWTKMLADLARSNGIDPAPPLDGATDPDEVPAEPDAAALYVQRGDLWQLGEHRLLCGDATSETDVARLLSGERPVLSVTDPPYGVDYNPAWRVRAAEEGHLAYAARRVGEVTNDDRANWSAAWKLSPSDVIYAWAPPGPTQFEHYQALVAANFDVRYQIIWSKPHFPIGRGNYHWRHEPCWYAVRKGCRAHWVGDRKQTTIWEISLDRNVEGGHSTQKPCECMERPLRNHTGDVYDPFVGSGTTIIAAERQHRRCFAMEIEPKYCQVSIERWQNYTSKQAELLSRVAD